MTNDFYCDQVLNGKTPVNRILETDRVLAYYHTRPFYEQHVVVIPKTHIRSLISDEDEYTDALLLEILEVIKKIAAQLVADYGACKIITNLGEYQESKHMHWHVVFGKKIR